MTKEEFIDYCNKIGININDSTIEKLETYKLLLQEWNNKFNLTTIINDKDIYLKHFYDSVYLASVVDLDNKNICDFGVGAGFPGMVLSIIYPNSSFTLIESNNKKVTFLNKVKETLNLDNVNIICDRAEDYGKTHRELFDIVTCRAVSSLKIILELSISLLKVNGLFVPLKSNVEEELNESKEKAKILGYELINKIDYKLPIEESNRCILTYKKLFKTDSKYPRSYNIIKKL